MALAYVAEGSFDIAEPLLLRALVITEETVGLEHPSTATMLNNLASLYEKQGLFGKAKFSTKELYLLKKKHLDLII